MRLPAADRERRSDRVVILESIVTSVDSAGVVNIAPMGPRVETDSEWKHFHSAAFRFLSHLPEPDQNQNRSHSRYRRCFAVCKSSGRNGQSDRAGSTIQGDQLVAADRLPPLVRSRSRIDQQ